MIHDEITVRRRRVIQRAPFTSEEAEYTVTVERRRGCSVTGTIKAVDAAVVRLLDQRLPFISTNIPAKKNPEQSRYVSLAWRRSQTTANLSTLRLSPNPTGLEKELYEKTMKGQYYEPDAIYELREYHGVKYIFRWDPVKK